MMGFVAFVQREQNEMFTMVGQGLPARFVDLGKTEPDLERLEVLLEYLPEAADYAMPRRDAEAEKISLMKHSSYHQPAIRPPFLERAIDVLVSRTPRFRRPEYLLPGPSVTRGLIRLVIESLNPEANAGYPYCVAQLKKRDYADANFEFVYGLVSFRLWALASMGPEGVKKMSPLQAVMMGFCDPYRVIIKNEPHKLAKIEDGRLRLVVCISVVDEIIDRILFTRSAKALIKDFLQTYSALGIGFDDETNQRVYKRVESFKRDGPVKHSDMRCWEWSVQEFDHDANAQVVLRTCDGVDETYSRLVLARTEMLKKGVYVTSDGVFFVQRRPGVNKSGGFQTASLNTRARAINSLLVGSPNQLCAGDDCTENDVENQAFRYRLLGKFLKESQEFIESFDFCSHRYSEGKARPLTIVKACYKYIVGEPSLDKLKQFAYVYRHSGDFERGLRAVVEASRNMAPRVAGPVVKPIYEDPDF